VSGLGLALSADQTAFGATLERFFAERYDADAGWQNGASVDAWAALVELGVTAASVPERAGGLGGGPAEMAVAMIAAGRSLAVEPLLATAVLGTAVLRHAGGAETLLAGIAGGTVHLATAYEEPGGRFDPAVVNTQAVQDGTRWRLSGVKSFVLNAGDADHLLVSARCDDGITLFIVGRAATGLTLRRFRTQDGLDVADLMLDGVPALPLGQPGGALGILAPALEEACIAVCACALGAMEAALAATTDYLSLRRQFGRPLASFQALQHRMVDMHMAVEETRSLLLAGIEALESLPCAERSRAVAALKIHTASSAIAIGQEAVQLHGGIGMTADGKVGRWYKRLLACATLFGDAAYHTGRYPLEDGDHFCQVRATAKLGVDFTVLPGLDPGSMRLGW
jgi:alkylation response protein AidB-like acyl-CoA dehydrogenase